MIQFLLTLKRIGILSLLKNLAKYPKEFWTLPEDCPQDFLEPRQTSLSLPQSMFLEEMVQGVSDETERTSFQDAISGPGSEELIETIESERSSLEENQTEGKQFLWSGF